MSVSIKNIAQGNLFRYAWWSLCRKQKEMKQRAAHVDAMNQMAERLGMVNTHYLNPQGLVENGAYCMTTARDLCLLTNAALQNKKLRSFYAKEYEITRHVPTVLCLETIRKKRVVAKIAESEINGHPILLEKTGGGDTHYALLMAVDIDGTIVCGAIMEAKDEDHRYPAMCELMTGVEQILKGKKLTKNCVDSAKTGCAYVVEKDGSLRCIYEQNPDDVYPTMSTAKMMTVYIAIDGLNESEYTTITPYDVEGTGIGDFLYRWDRISVRDLIYLCLLPSCCVAANAIARLNGKRILNTQK